MLLDSHRQSFDTPKRSVAESQCPRRLQRGCLQGCSAFSKPGMAQSFGNLFRAVDESNCTLDDLPHFQGVGGKEKG